ncbi:putative phage-type endonuclease [Paraburkholderia sp. CI2]|uniref:YqaJ viral recombinase family nuclease n=1 Tax=Paraburkholderia sp. CI2 TaxID=2723093 RepID=UPI00161F7467|nr:YqaJ viral recombinase family protein [Paraburkholderia sp. CI2]MBB5469352.1 putative phage-type endonuclease [Paraburkholderia sp. CI2]
MGSRDEWLAERRKGVGGSDAAAALGQSRHKTMFALYQEKTDDTFDALVLPDQAERMRFGQRMEQVIADEYAQRYGVKLRRHNRLAYHPKYGHMLANYDRTIDGRREGLEAKNVDALSYRFGEWGEPGSDEIPPEYMLQCAHYLAVSGYDVWHLAACIGGNRLEVYHVERDAEMIDLIEQGEADFWAYVERREAPTLDYRHPSAIPLLRRMYPSTNGETVTLPAEAEALHYARLDFAEQSQLFENGADAAKARILHLMGEASVGLLPNGGGYTRRIIERKAYEVGAMKYVDFRFSAKKGATQ